MTRPPKLAKCREGHEAEIHQRAMATWLFVRCQISRCWVGPECRTPGAAGRAWNRAMKRGKQR